MTEFCLQRNPPTCVTSTEHPTTDNWDALTKEPEAVTVSVVTPIPDAFTTSTTVAVVEVVPVWSGPELPHTGYALDALTFAGMLLVGALAFLGGAKIADRIVEGKKKKR